MERADDDREKPQLHLNEGLHVAVAQGGPGGRQEAFEFQRDRRSDGGQAGEDEGRHEDTEGFEAVREGSGGAPRLVGKRTNHGAAPAPRLKDAPSGQRRAARTVARLTPSVSASIRSEGKRSKRLHRPSSSAFSMRRSMSSCLSMRRLFT